LPLSAEEKVLDEGDVTDFYKSRIIESIDKDQESEMDSFAKNREKDTSKSYSMAISGKNGFNTKILWSKHKKFTFFHKT
jgi:hypothetical protein